MWNNQTKFIEYAKGFAQSNQRHIWLGGSFLQGNATAFSDVDISVWCNAEEAKRLIEGYGEVVYLSYTQKPFGILIVIYADGVAVDMEIVDDAVGADTGYFHLEDIRKYPYKRNEMICRKLALQDDLPYQMARLFHRSLIKFFSGKQAMGVSVANEMASFLHAEPINAKDYENKMLILLQRFISLYTMHEGYRNLLFALINEEKC